jgi:hypothetical protein
MLKYLRVAVTALSLTACVLLIALWARSYWWYDTAHCPLRGPQMLIVTSYDGRLSLYAGGHVPYRTGWFPSGWGRDSVSVDNIAPPSNKQPRPSWTYNSDQYGRHILFPYWLPISITAALSAAPWMRQLKLRFSLRTLLIATTLVGVMLGIIVMSS